MKLSIGTDEISHLFDFIVDFLEAEGHQIILHSPKINETIPWSEVARSVAKDVKTGRAAQGILLCWTGTGVSIAANKIPGVRAALCDDAETARGAKLWNNANVLCLSIRRTSDVIAKEILECWFSTTYKPNANDDTCLAIIEELENYI